MFQGREALIEALDEVEVAADADAIVEARRIRDRLDARIAAAEAEFTQNRGHEAEGHATYASFLRARCAMTVTESRRLEVRARKLGRLPEVLDAWRADRLNGTQVDVISVKVPVHHLDRFAELVDDTISIIEPLSVANTQKVLKHWVSAADDAAQTEAAERGEIPTEPAIPKRELSASRTTDDRLEVSGSFDQDSAAKIEDALRAATRPDADGEVRSPKQRRADALVDMAAFYLAHHQNPPSTARPDRGVIVADIVALFRGILRGDGVHTAAQLQTWLDHHPQLGALERGLFLDAFDGKGGTARTLDGYPVTDLLLRHVMENGILERLLRQGSRIIDHGRSTRVFTESQKRAMAVRDGGSRISGDSPFTAQAHHSPPFEDGGTTDVNAGYLKTPREHLDQHRRGFVDEIHDDGSITQTGPDGTTRRLRPTQWPGDEPKLPVASTAEPAPTLPFRPPIDPTDRRTRTRDRRHRRRTPRRAPDFVTGRTVLTLETSSTAGNSKGRPSVPGSVRDEPRRKDDR